MVPESAKISKSVLSYTVGAKPKCKKQHDQGKTKENNGLRDIKRRGSFLGERWDTAGRCGSCCNK